MSHQGSLLPSAIHLFSYQGLGLAGKSSLGRGEAGKGCGWGLGGYERKDAEGKRGKESLIAIEEIGKTEWTKHQKDRCMISGQESGATCEPSKVDFHSLPPCLSQN